MKAPSGVVWSGYRKKFTRPGWLANPAKEVTQLIHLNSLKGQSLGNIDEINSISPTKDSALRVSRNWGLHISGWAVSSTESASASAVYIELGGRLFAAHYGIPRPDVAAAYKTSAYSNSGYEADLSLRDFSPGQKILSVIVPNENESGYYTASTVKLSIE
jgi:hypothetical protein